MALREILLAGGFCLIMAGVFLRGLARSHRRLMAARKQHDLDVRATGTPPVRESHFDRCFSLYANATLLAGVAVVIVGCLL